MFDLGWTELMVIGIVALIVVGPKDLPGMFRTVGQFVGKAKGMAREFTKAMNDAADESGMREVSDSLRKATKPVSSTMDEVRKGARSFTEATRDAGKPALKPDPAQDDSVGARDKTAGEKALEAHARDAEAAKKKADAPAKPAAAKKPPAKKTAPKKTPAKSAAAKPAAKKAPAKPKAGANKTTGKTAASKAAPKKTAAKAAGGSTAKDKA
ncbi:twin-arginine translocase subunit TatB [Roseovarius spongiae]|uniref:Sec-independent protein translocase protein TatB n=1 Tax=Roseovarius spongiae TaxID=2320272 RepID=A0A3A8BA78_9RHOB|nr:Sec-independent protein translocase protein TatB [Roseovarius spongiae]RKF15373.1 twin-arginine translocase subunit TatB [Roseovarius spongiae]